MGLHVPSKAVSLRCISLTLVSSNSMREGHGRWYTSCRKSLQGRQNVLALGSCLQALHLLASHTASSCCEWVGSQGRRSEESKQTSSCITGTQTFSVFAAKLMTARDPMVQFSQLPWELLGKVEMGYSYSHLSWSAFQPGVTTLCT